MMSQNSSVLSSMSLGNKNNKYIYSDEQLMLLFQGGNENAYIELVNRYKDKLINFMSAFFLLYGLISSPRQEE